MDGIIRISAFDGTEIEFINKEYQTFCSVGNDRRYDGSDEHSSICQ